jgi:hypothetical protein
MQATSRVLRSGTRPQAVSGPSAGLLHRQPPRLQTCRRPELISAAAARPLQALRNGSPGSSGSGAQQHALHPPLHAAARDRYGRVVAAAFMLPEPSSDGPTIPDELPEGACCIGRRCSALLCMPIDQQRRVAPLLPPLPKTPQQTRRPPPRAACPRAPPKKSGFARAENRARVGREPDRRRV